MEDQLNELGKAVDAGMVDLTGGYYDAGDNVKFNFPMAFTTTISWGDPNVDHKCWERPEDMDTVRTVYSVSPSNLAQMLPGAYSDSLGSAVCPFYCSYSGYKDELLWGAAWLFMATNQKYYYDLLKSLGDDDQSDIFSWDNKYAGGHVLLSRRALLNNDKNFEQYKLESENFMCRILPNSPSTSTQYTRGGLMYKLPQSNLQYVTSITFLLTTYAKYMKATKHTFNCGNLLVTPNSLLNVAKRQVDYILGVNPLQMSYMVGFGPHYPKRIHHRGSSLPSLASHPLVIGCDGGFQPFFYTANPNPNILTGAIVGGPDQNDGFPDDRSDYSHSEPATYINAAIVGPLAYLVGSTSI
ncbi:hypothetical protein GH714_014947 [Hevea brasiliensis]|uniref:Endoglucanase n=1 Tax=Hevea brasiliensis TaxID=3981 RepID=A0A6A6KRJ2_HEVBR|nr:hypothetical protein GH714_014947 [Hevea brasiliensis]